jgi:hypothetical protein
VSDDSRVREERLITLVGVEVGAADPDAMDADESLTRWGSARLCPLRELKAARFLQHDDLHAHTCSSGETDSGKPQLTKISHMLRVN